MAIELIDKIKQKNNGTYKLVDAIDVEMADHSSVEDTVTNHITDEDIHLSEEDRTKWDGIELTQAEYDALVESGEVLEDVNYYITDGGEVRPFESLKRLRSYLYEVTFDTLPEYNNDDDAPFAGGCTSFIKNGKLHRNLDWNYSETAAFKVVTKNFVGMAFDDSIKDSHLDNEKIGQLPYHVNDGVNDYGIMVTTHVLYNDWNWDNADGNTSITKLPYIILSTVKSMNELSSKLSTVLSDLYAPDALKAMGYLVHFMVSDGTTTYVIEPPTSSTGAYQLINATDCPKFVNFRWINKAEITSRNDSALQNRPNGIERWNLIPCELSDLRYTKTYETNAWLSEFIGVNETTKASTDAQLQAIYELGHTAYLNRTRNDEIPTWQTFYSVVYSNKGMEHLWAQEDWNRDYCSSTGVWERGSGTNSVIVSGSQSLASGDYATAEGFANRASGTYSHAEGVGNIISIDGTSNPDWNMGIAAHLEGSGNTAAGNYSHVEGANTLANNIVEHAEGQYNKSNMHSTTFGDSLNTLRSVGIGTIDNARKNAEEIMQNGDQYIIGIGGYDGTNPSTADSLQDVVNSKIDEDALDDYYDKDAVDTLLDAKLTTPTTTSSDNGKYIKYQYDSSTGVGTWVMGTGSSGTEVDYADLENKPQIGGIELVGNKTAESLNLMTLSTTQNITAGAIKYSRPNNFKIPTDLPYIQPANTDIATYPATREAFHDVAAFLQHGELTLTVEKTTNGLTWTTATASDFYNLFLGTETITTKVIDTTEKGVRFTLVGNQLKYSNVSWVEIATAYAASQPRGNVEIERSNDSGVTWTSIINAVTNINFDATNAYYIPLKNPLSSDHDRIRITITRTSDLATVNLAGIKLFSSRKGNQGSGIDNELPFKYTFNEDIVPRVNNKSKLGSSDKKWNIVYGDTFSGNTFTGLAAKATADAAGNNIVDTYAKKVDTYTKTETDTLLDEKLDKDELSKYNYDLLDSIEFSINGATDYDSSKPYYKFMEVTPVDNDLPFTFVIRTTTEVVNNPIANGVHLIQYTISKDTSGGYALNSFVIDNRFISTNYRDFYNLSFMRPNNVGVANDAPVCVGFNLDGSCYKYNSSTRNCLIELLKVDNCEVSLMENVVKSNSAGMIPSPHTSSEYNSLQNSNYIATIGRRQTGDQDTMTRYQVADAFYVDDYDLYRYRFVGRKPNGHIAPFVTTDKTGTTAGVVAPNTTTKFAFGGEIYFYKSTANISEGSKLNSYTLDLALSTSQEFRYGTTVIDNGIAIDGQKCGNTDADVLDKLLYLKALDNEDGTYSLDSELSSTDISYHYATSLPSEDDGHIYIFLGWLKSVSAIEVAVNKTIYKWNGKSYTPYGMGATGGGGSSAPTVVGTTLVFSGSSVDNGNDDLY